MIVKFLTPELYTLWDEYVLNHVQATPYHLTVWKDIIESYFGKETKYLFVETDGQIKAVLPMAHFSSRLFGNRLVSMPHVNYGGLLCSDEESARLLLQKAAEILSAKGADLVELRHKDNIFPDLPSYQNKVTFELELDSTVEAFSGRFKAKLRSQIKRPQKEGMYARSGHQELLKDFYYVFSRNMRDLGTPVYGRDFFITMLTRLGNSARIVTVYTADHQPAAAAFLIGFREVLEIPWASALRKYNHLSPNMLLYWECMTYGIESGYKLFDFGRGTIDGGTYKFKKQWGGTERQLYWHYILPENTALPGSNKENPKFSLAIKIWQKLPLAITKLLGPAIVKNIP